jgi:hypothetical protein
MPEESDVNAPEPVAPASAGPASAGPAEARPGHKKAHAPSPAPSSTSRRKPLIIGFGAGILVAALVAVVLVAVRPGAQQLKYTSLPAPCDLVSAASLAKYMPDVTSSPQSTPSNSTDQQGACTWSSITGGQDRSLLVQVDVFGSSSGPSRAQQSYQREVSGPGCCKGLKISTRPVTGLGDQAMALVITQSEVKGAPGLPPGAALVVRSGNADINLTYSIFPIGSAKPALTIAAQQAGEIAMARDVLAALANPAAAASPAAATSVAPSSTASPSPLGPRYASPHDPCTLIKAATLARYAPGAAAKQIPVPAGTVPGTPQLSNCGWEEPNGSIVLELTIDPDSPSARQGYEFAVQYARQNKSGTKFHGAQAVTGVGQQATAIFQTILGNSPSVALYVWSGNAEFQISFTDLPFSTPPSRATKLAADIAMARDVLAALPT